MRTAAFLLLAALPLCGQEDAQALLDRVRSHMAGLLKKQPDFACLETIERANRSPREITFRPRDTVRLEVALVNGKEMFAFPGSKEFEDYDLRTFVPLGMFGNGYFGLYATAVFEDSRTEFQFRGTDPGPAVRYDFRVPAESGMRVSSMGSFATTGYHGSLYVNPVTAEAARIEVEAEPLPVKLELREVRAAFDYARMRIHGIDMLMPESSEMVMTNWRDEVSRNVIRLSGCREFAGTSAIAFGPKETGAGGSGTPQKQEIRLPKRATLRLRLVEEIDIDHGAVGDLVRAVLDSDVKEDGKTLLPKGSLVNGRLVRLERDDHFTVLGLMFFEAETESLHSTLSLTFVSAAGPEIPRALRGMPHSPVQPHEGLILVQTGHGNLGNGVVLIWRT